MLIKQLNLLGRAGNKWLDYYLIFLLFANIIGFLSFKGATNTCLFLLLIPSLFFLKRSVGHAIQTNIFRLIWPILIALSLPIIAILISQFGRQDWEIRNYDGPSRMFFSIPILLFLIYKKVDFSRIIALASPLALWLIAISVYLHPEIVTQESGRFATTFVRPNAFGTYTTVLTSFCLFHLVSPSKPSNPWVLYQMAGILVGLPLIIGSGTRGSWIAIPFIIFIWLFFNYRKIRVHFSWILVLIVSIYLSSNTQFFSYIGHRAFSGFYEITSWVNQSNVDTPTGFRLSIWKISWKLFIHNPLFGYGNMGYADYLTKPWFSSTASDAAKAMLACCGTHNELLANTLRSGIIGTMSVLFLFFAPFKLFVANTRHSNTNIANAARLGLAYITCIAICSISIEVFNLKYLSSFYGLMIAGLTAQIVGEQA